MKDDINDPANDNVNDRHKRFLLNLFGPDFMKLINKNHNTDKTQPPNPDSGITQKGFHMMHFNDMGDFNFDNLDLNKFPNFSQFPKEGDPNFVKTEKTVKIRGGHITATTWTSKDGTQHFHREEFISSNNVKKKNDTGHIGNISLPELKKDLKQSLETENYERAAQIRDLIKSVEDRPKIKYKKA